ncbi:MULTISPECIES: hypothetical protein [unclassified Pseudofrankia]|uniref:hypothetical protein n=1 Tax=unclassified Pseudofrankia TaxID=2994372 RepID=UPI0008DACF59|nr:MULTISPECIES: hypothetical protein [unclassified Pseudofrankia]MDT3446522.1 hypothetical protein [Pseudofrankia sp. BMG5.37]OHV43906.1 hypothetical protein BCD48_26220 [Pseudofrankia sp. BMG5.36]
MAGPAGTRPSGRARRVGGLIVALIVPLVLVGCTGGSGSPPGDVATRQAGGTAPPPPPSPTASASASTEAGSGSRLDLRAVNFVLTAGPDTPGFASEPSSKDDYEETPDDDFAKCLGIAAADLQDTSTDTAYGPQLTDAATGLSMSSIASIVPAGTLDRDVKLLRNPRYPRCVAESFLAQQRADAPSMEIVSAGVGPELPGVLGSTSLVFRVKVEDLARAGGGAGGGVVTAFRPGAAGAASGPGGPDRLVGTATDDGSATLAARPAAERAPLTIEIYYDVYYAGKSRVETMVHVVGYVHRPDPSRIAPAVAQVVGKIDRQG